MQCGILDWIMEQKKNISDKQRKSKQSPEHSEQYFTNIQFLVLVIVLCLGKILTCGNAAFRKGIVQVAIASTAICHKL